MLLPNYRGTLNLVLLYGIEVEVPSLGRGFTKFHVFVGTGGRSGARVGWGRATWVGLEQTPWLYWCCRGVGSNTKQASRLSIFAHFSHLTSKVLGYLLGIRWGSSRMELCLYKPGILSESASSWRRGGRRGRTGLGEVPAHFRKQMFSLCAWVHPRLAGKIIVSHNRN